MDKKRMYSEDQIRIKKQLGKVLATLDQALTLERATVHHKTRDIIAASNQEFPTVVAAHRTWLRGRITRLTLLELMFQDQKRLGEKVEKKYAKMLQALTHEKSNVQAKG